MKTTKKIVVVGGGFAGLALVKRLGKASGVEVVLVDGNNYNFFPPLIYQVSTGFMEPSAISYPFRKIIRDLDNVRFRLGRLERVVPEENRIILDNGELTYDVLVMATGTEPNYFGNQRIEELSLPLKTISDALSLRNVILTRFDRATRLTDPAERRRYLNFVIAGAGPTGVELAGILAEMKTSVLRKDYPELSQEDLGDIILVDGQDSPLFAMSPASREYTSRKLTQLGVELVMSTLVSDFDGDTVYLSNGDEIQTKNLIWAAGVSARTFAGFSHDSYGTGKRLRVDRFNRLAHYDNIFALGDCAIIADDEDYPLGHPQLAQPAIQQAENLAVNLLRGDRAWKPFQYWDKGSMAIIGRNKAVLDFPGNKYTVKGFVAWCIWIFIHIAGLINFRNRIRTLLNWLGYYINKDQYFRMIIKPNQQANLDEDRLPVPHPAPVDREEVLV